MTTGIVELGKELEIEFDEDDEVKSKQVLDNDVELTFFDESTNDFRLNVEGRSGTGKTNTLAVIIEELADYNIPTLVLDRLGVLTTAAIEVDNMVVVGARDEPGIDIAVPLDEVEIIVDMLLEQGMKVMMDLQTYKGLGEEEEQTLHKAVADVLDELMDRSHQMMRAGNRRRSLVIADEVHHLAPETGTQHVDPVDRHVKRCRSMLMNLATEGGNKGVSSIYSYQRRALTKNTVVSQSDNYITHKLEAGDKDRASKETGIPGKLIDALDVGEVVVKGEVNEDYIRTVKVKRRESPDPREEEFEVPEPPEELGEALEQIQEQVEQKEKKRKEKQDKIEKLENKLEQKEKKIESLEQEANVAETIRRAVNREGGGDVDEEVIQELEQLQDEKEKLENQLEEAHKDLSEAESKKEELKYEVEDLKTELEEYKDLERAKEDVVASAKSILRQFGELDTDAEDARQQIQELKEEMSDLREENRKLKQRKSTDTDIDSKIDDYEELIEDDDVKEVIEEAKEESHASPRYISGVIANIINKGGWVSYSTIADNLGIKDTSNVGKAASTLESYGVIKKEKRNGEQHVDLNTGEDGIKEIKRKAEERRKTSELMEKV